MAYNCLWALLGASGCFCASEVLPGASGCVRLLLGLNAEVAFPACALPLSAPCRAVSRRWPSPPCSRPSRWRASHPCTSSRAWAAAAASSRGPSAHRPCVRTASTSRRRRWTACRRRTRRPAFAVAAVAAEAAEAAEAEAEEMPSVEAASVAEGSLSALAMTPQSGSRARVAARSPSCARACATQAGERSAAVPSAELPLRVPWAASPGEEKAKRRDADVRCGGTNEPVRSLNGFKISVRSGPLFSASRDRVKPPGFHYHRLFSEHGHANEI